MCSMAMNSRIFHTCARWNKTKTNYNLIRLHANDIGKGLCYKRVMEHILIQAKAQQEFHMNNRGIMHTVSKQPLDM